MTKRTEMEISVARIDDLVPYARQARTKFDENRLHDLAESIDEFGILEPLLVRPIECGKFEIIAGERRWRAARLAGLTTVPVIAQAMDDDTADRVHIRIHLHY